MLVLCAGLALVERLRHFAFSANQRTTASVALALFPLILWLLISYRGERRVPSPRTRLLGVTILGFLAASAIGIPLVDRVLGVNDWLSTASGLNRILGFTFTTGIVHEFLKYAAVRYSVWPGAIRIRSDGVAYAMAAGIGYATAININFVITQNGQFDPAAAALHMTGVALSQVAISSIMGYLLAELKLTRPSPVFALPLGLIFAALLSGIYAAVRAGIIVGGIGTTATGSNALPSLGVSIFFVLALFSGLNVVISNADERARLRNQPETP